MTVVVSRAPFLHTGDPSLYLSSLPSRNSDRDMGWLIQLTQDILSRIFSFVEGADIAESGPIEDRIKVARYCTKRSHHVSHPLCLSERS